MRSENNIENILKKSREAASHLLYRDSSAILVENQEISNVVSKLSDEKVLSDELSKYNHFDSDIAFEKVCEKIHKRKSRSKIVRYVRIASSVAAAIAILFISFQLIEKDSPVIEKIAEQQELKIVIPEGKIKAQLIDNKGITSNIDHTTKEIKVGDNIVKNDPTTSSLSYESVSSQKIEINKLKIPKGGVYQVVLQDGTKVTLNSDSYLEYPTVFNGKRREVKLIGEALFDVAHKKESSFIVKTQRGEVKVFGTVFNVKSYENESTTNVILVNGSVGLSNEVDNVRLAPGESGIIKKSNETIVKKKVNIERSLAWVHNMFDYEDAPMDEIINDLNRCYDVDIQIPTVELRNLLVTFKISKSRSLEEVLITLEKSGVINIVKNENSYSLKYNL